MKNLKKTSYLQSIEAQVKESFGLPSDTETIEEIVLISKELPADVTGISPEFAEYLAGRFLKGLSLCNELYAISVGYELKKEILRKKEHGDALISRSKAKGCKTGKEMEAYADTDDIYVSAANSFAEAKVLRIMVENIRDDFEKAHYLMKKISEKDRENDYLKHKNREDLPPSGRLEPKNPTGKISWTGE